MNLRRSILLTLSVLGFCSLLSATAQGPDEKGSVLRTPFDAPAATTPIPPNPAPPVTASSASPSYLKAVLPDSAPGRFDDPNPRRSLNPDDDLQLNRDLQITPAAGNWLVMVISYPGKNGPVEARKMCLELRNNKRVPAYVFVFGAEERRKEYDRVKKIIDRQQEFFKKQGVWPEEPLRVRHQQIDVQHAVLMGGYPDADAAKSALNAIKNWPSPDPAKVALEHRVEWVPDPQNLKKALKAESAPVNPYKRAFVARNPTVKQETVEPKMDVATLRRLNSDEPLSLFNCKKPFTLAVKEYQTPFTMQDKDASPTIWDSLGANKNNKEDFARKSAHNLAESLRQRKLDAFVLHGKFSSSVTVGSFDAPNDPALLAMQETLATRFNQPPFTQFPLSQIQFFHRPVPMAVPR